MNRREFLKWTTAFAAGVTVTAYLTVGIGPAGAQDKKWTIGFSQATTSEPWRAQFNKDIIAEAERVRRKAEMGGGALLEQLRKIEREFRAERRRDYFRSPLRLEAAGALKAAREAVRDREGAAGALGTEGKV